MTRVMLAAAVVFTASYAGAAAPAMIRAPGAAEKLVLVEHVDVLPDHAAQAKDAISRYVEAVRGEPGALRIDAMQELRQNHFDMVEIWRDETAYRTHQSSPATRRFRGAVTPWLGSPLDERVGTPIAR